MVSARLWPQMDVMEYFCILILLYIGWVFCDMMFYGYNIQSFKQYGSWIKAFFSMKLKKSEKRVLCD
jgi:hypothetical protein